MSGPMRSLGFVIGVDLGTRQDHSAIVIVEKLRPISPEAEAADTWPTPYRVPVAETHFRIREFGRLPLGVSYMAAARAIADVVHNVNCADVDHPPRLFLDATGVGAPVVDSLEGFLPSGVRAMRVLWTGGERLRKVGGEYHVGKAWCVSRLQALIDVGRISVPDTEQAHQLLDELMAFEIRITDHGSVIAGARSGQHDDLVMSLALCVLEDGSAGPRRASRPLNADRPLPMTDDPWMDLHAAPSTLW